MESNDILSAAGRQMSQRSESSDSNSHVCYLFFSIFTLKERNQKLYYQPVKTKSDSFENKK
jgi:hypothetical protein